MVVWHDSQLNQATVDNQASPAMQSFYQYSDSTLIALSLRTKASLVEA